MSNNIVHLELGVSNLPDGVKFYKQVFPQWQINKAPEIPDYYFVQDENNPDSMSIGIGLVDTVESKGSIIFYVNVGDIPQAIERIIKAGGRVLMEKTAIGGDNGYISRFEDPYGNIIGIWSQT